MKNAVYLIVFLVMAAAPNLAQTPTSSSRFPGISATQIKQLQAAKKLMQIPLPTWLPAGFKASGIESKLGSRVPLQDKVLNISYSKKLATGKTQCFRLEAGFDGLGGLPYDVTKVIPSAVGKIDLMYEPKDLDGGGRVKNFAMTEWFRVGRTDFHYDGMCGQSSESEGVSYAMISLADTEKILRSLQRF